VLACAPAEEGEEAHADRMAEEHAGDTAEPSPAAAAEPSAPVRASEVVYANVEGQDVTGYLARPEEAEGDLPALIVIHEWWGLNDNIRSMARQLAGEGYLALAVDLYGGDTASDPDGARALMGAVAQNPEPAKENLRLAHAYLNNELGAARVGSIGWCFGGGWSLTAGLTLGEELDATVIYYGRLATDPEELAAVQAPVLGLFGALDGTIPVETVREFESAMQELGKDVRIHVYDGADHAFANPSGTRYDAEAATDAWQKTLAFLAETLKG
jgi:carboxymethylenebutenolidase